MYSIVVEYKLTTQPRIPGTGVGVSAVRNKKCCLQKYFYTEFLLMSKYNTLSCVRKIHTGTSTRTHTHILRTRTHTLSWSVFWKWTSCSMVTAAAAELSAASRFSAWRPRRWHTHGGGGVHTVDQTFQIVESLYGFLALSHCRGPEEHQTLMERCTLSKIDVPWCEAMTSEGWNLQAPSSLDWEHDNWNYSA